MRYRSWARAGPPRTFCPTLLPAGKVQLKTGNRVVGTAADQLIVLGNSLAGYIQTKSGRQVTFAITVDNVPI